MHLKSYKVCSKIFEHGNDPPFFEQYSEELRSCQWHFHFLVMTIFYAKFWRQFWQFVWNFFTISKILTVLNVFYNSWQFWQFWMFSEFSKVFVTWGMTLKTLTNTLWPLNKEWSWQHSQFLRCFMTNFDDIETIFDNWKDSPGDLTFEALIKILTIGNLNSVNHFCLTIYCDSIRNSTPFDHYQSLSARKGYDSRTLNMNQWCIWKVMHPRWCTVFDAEFA